MNIYVTKEDLENSLSMLEKNKNTLILGNNCFDTTKIITLLNFEENCDIFYNESISFKFSYNDNILSELINVFYNYESDNCNSFINESKLIDEDSLSELIAKVTKNNGSNIENLTHSNEYKKIKFNECLKNEIQLYLSTNINENDKEFTIDDFRSKYDLFKNRINEKNNQVKKLIVDLYSKLLNIKILG